MEFHPPPRVLPMNPDDFDPDSVLMACLDDIWHSSPNQAAESVSSRVAKLDRASRMGVLVEILNDNDVGPDYFWPIFIAWRPDFEFPHMWENLVDRLRDVNAIIPAYSYLSSADQAFFHSLPKGITVYRGASGDFPPGVSWTTDKAKAPWFAQRFRKHSASVLSGIVCKGNIWAVFTGRGESEILCDPLAVRIRGRENYP